MIFIILAVLIWILLFIFIYKKIQFLSDKQLDLEEIKESFILKLNNLVDYLFDNILILGIVLSMFAIAGAVIACKFLK
jgi:hypothetical protein